MANAITDYLSTKYDQKEALIGAERLRYSERMIMLQILDNQWKDHLLSMDHLKEGIGLRGYGQKDPLVEYKKESFEIFQAMMERFEEETIRLLFHLQPAMPRDESQARPARPLAPEPENGAPAEPAAAVAPHGDGGSIEDFTRDVRRKKERELAHVRMAGAGDAGPEVKQVVRGDKVGRNDPCPCGSGKKYKKCHGA
jgi:preprotein translocase subunit SecA